MSFKGKQNIYTCKKCNLSIVTEDKDEGVTPFSLGCKATENCDGHMLSAFYPKIPYRFVPHFIWRKATPEEYKTANKGMRDHFDKGGLDIYQVSEI